MSRRLSFTLLVVLAAMLMAGCSYQPARIKSEPLIVIDGGGGTIASGHQRRPLLPARAGQEGALL